MELNLPIVKDIETAAGVRTGFFEELAKEDDWSFVIKLHAFIESVATHMIVHHFDEPEVRAFFARLEISNPQTGKMALLKSLGLIGKEGRQYIRALSELRNSLVHEVQNCEYSLTSMVNSLSSKELKQFSVKFAPHEAKEIDPDKGIGFRQIQGDKLASFIARAKDNPKLHIWAGALNVLIILFDMKGFSKYRQYEKAEKVFDE